MISTREDDHIWELVSYDPVCNNVRAVGDALAGNNFPVDIITQARTLWRMVVNDTYDRLEKPYDVRVLQETEAH